MKGMKVLFRFGDWIEEFEEKGIVISEPYAKPYSSLARNRSDGNHNVGTPSDTMIIVRQGNDLREVKLTDCKIDIEENDEL